MTDDPCSAILKNDERRHVHICAEKKGHDGPHRCGRLRAPHDFTCLYEWPA